MSHRYQHILVLGANGFLGRHFCHYLETQHISFTAHSDRIESYQDIDEVVSRVNPDAIVNLIGKNGNLSFDELYFANAQVTRYLYECLLAQSRLQTRVLLLGSAAEYGIPTKFPTPEDHPLAPINFYGLSKVFQTHLFHFFNRRHHMSSVLVRLFNVIGPDLPLDTALGDIHNKIAKANSSDQIVVGDLTISRDFLTVSDVCRGIHLALEQGQDGEIYNLCSGKEVPLADLVNAMTNRSGKSLSLISRTDAPQGLCIRRSQGSAAKIRNQCGFVASQDIFKSLPGSPDEL